MSDLRTAAQQALEALVWEAGSEPALYSAQTLSAITALRAALAQQAEPVACKEQITVEELAAALGWPGGISTPLQGKVELLRIVAHARVAQQAEPVERRAAIDEIHAAWFLAGVGMAGGNWERFFDMLPPHLKQQAEPVQRPSCEDLGYVALSEDGRSVFIDGIGLVPLAHQAEPVATVKESLPVDCPACGGGGLIPDPTWDWVRCEMCNPLKTRATLAHQAEPKQKPEPFVIKHYSGDERPMIKGNGFDGLGIGDDREEAELFVTWVNARITAQQAEPQWCACEPTRCEGMGRCRWQAMKYVPPAQQAERKPLTDEEIVRCLVAAKCVGTVNMSYDAGPYYITRPSRAATWFARAVELAHGITEGQR